VSAKNSGSVEIQNAQLVAFLDRKLSLHSTSHAVNVRKHQTFWNKALSTKKGRLA
jgi:hypothetical protein